MSLPGALYLLPGLVIAVTVHEFAHAWTAGLLGDGWPRRQGRVTLNPLRHLSLVGTLMLFLLPFGWGRPVVVNLYNFRRPRRDYFLSSVAGPVANLVVVAACFGLMFLTRRSFQFGESGATAMAVTHAVLTGVALLNALVAALNLLPIPPLDGSKVWPCLIPSVRPTFSRPVSLLSVVLLMALVVSGVADPVIGAGIRRLHGLMPVDDLHAAAGRYDDAEAAYEAQDYLRSEQLLNQTLAIRPHWGAALYLRALSRGQRLDWTGALDDLNAAIQRDPGVAEYYEYRAQLLDRRGLTTQAAQDRTKAAALHQATTRNAK